MTDAPCTLPDPDSAHNDNNNNDNNDDNNVDNNAMIITLMPMVTVTARAMMMSSNLLLTKGRQGAPKSLHLHRVLLQKSIIVFLVCGCLCLLTQQCCSLTFSLYLRIRDCGHLHPRHLHPRHLESRCPPVGAASQGTLALLQVDTH